jgi:hypothetical protein
MSNEALAVRLARLERHNRRLTVALVVVGIGSSIAVFLGAEPKPPRVVEAERFVLRDDQGRARATLTMNEKAPELALLSELGKPRLTLSAAAQDATLSIRDQGEAVAELKVTPEGPGLKLVSGKSSVLMGILPAGIGLGIVDRAGTPRERLMVTPTGAPLLDLWDRQGHVLFRVP